MGSLVLTTGSASCVVCHRECGEHASVWKVEDLEYFSAGPVQYVRCVSCGLIKQEPLPSVESLPSFYPANYRNYLPVERNLMVLLKNIQADLLATRIAHKLGFGRSKKILDIGFGNGQLLLAFARQGFENLYGSDFNRRDCRYLEEKGIAITFSNVEQEFPFQGAFDCIIMNNVIEHFVDPLTVLKLCREHLSPGGCLVMITPNSDSFDLSLFGRFWAGFHAPRHTFIFNELSMMKIAKTLNYSDCRTEGFDDPGQWAISIQNVLQDQQLTRTSLKCGLAPYTVLLSILVTPIVCFQRLFGRPTAIMTTFFC